MANTDIRARPTDRAGGLRPEPLAASQPDGAHPSREDSFAGDNERLIACIDALLDLDDAGALVPHGLGKGSHAYRLLTAASARLAALAWLEGQHGLTLYHHSPMREDDADQAREWRIDRESGPINDREWETVGRSETISGAIWDARRQRKG